MLLIKWFERFKPIIKKYARRCRTEDIGSEIVEWIIRATLKYKENIISGKEGLEKQLKGNQKEQ